MELLAKEVLVGLAAEAHSACVVCDSIQRCWGDLDEDNARKALNGEDYTDSEGNLVSDEDYEDEDEDYDDEDGDVEEDSCDGECEDCNCGEEDPAAPTVDPSHLLEMFLDETKADLDQWAEDMSLDEVENGFAPTDEEKKAYREAELLYNEIYRLREFELNNR